MGRPRKYTPRTLKRDVERYFASITRKVRITEPVPTDRDPDKNPEFVEITQQVYERMKAWNERELLTRPGKDIKGIVFNLENNYGYRERHDLDFSSKGIEEYLQKLEEAGGGGSL